MRYTGQRTCVTPLLKAGPLLAQPRQIRHAPIWNLLRWQSGSGTRYPSTELPRGEGAFGSARSRERALVAAMTIIWAALIAMKQLR